MLETVVEEESKIPAPCSQDSSDHEYDIVPNGKNVLIDCNRVVDQT